ncbi:MAG: hypothetical protein AAFQ89_20870 [Cyanobacteria bacterium J06626_18]
MVSVARQLGEQARATSVQIYQKNAHLLNRYGRWFWLAWLAALVDGKLLLAIALSTLTYRLVTTGYQIPWEKLEPLCDRFYTQIQQISHNPLGAGMLTFGATYGLTAAWSELGGSWAAAALSGLSIMNVLLLARSKRSESTDPQPFDQLFEDLPESQWQHLTASDPVQRLLAVRSLLRWSLSEAGAANYLPGTDVTGRSHLVDCFRVMLTHETEPLVRVALIEGLKALQPKPQLSPGQPAIQPLVARSPHVQAQRCVEYVEP